MTTTTNTLDGALPTITLADPAELIASLPPLLGFRPADSLLLLGLTGAEGRRLRSMVRADLPPEGKEPDAVCAVMDVFGHNGLQAVEIVVVGNHPAQPPPSSGPPHRLLVDLLGEAFEELRIPVRHATWTPEIRGGAPWCCYREKDCGGTLPDDLSTVAAATIAMQGGVTYRSREDLLRQLAPDDPEALARRTEMLNAAIDALDPSVPPAALTPGYAKAVRAAIEAVRRGDLSFSDEQLVELAMALCDPYIRDAGLAAARVPHCSRDAERLWLELVRRIPAPERAEPAVLLAYSAYLRGEGALAGIALDNALEASPGHVLADLLERCRSTSMPPDRLRTLAQHEHHPDIFPPPENEPA
ncbi:MULTISPECIES: DUF4192 domain-containing protein [Amycolatopsis]|uniref:DUF4192 domain-containing protein n=2 Tax=Amycolatopsis TaxID=1813 RepID=A0A1I3Z1Z9_9PSEU|nr:DUF4192 domain-containing protein [Amycolatopsis sacchari]SFK37526.1 protein of unknown function [Amycolatopsis sacchari]